MPFRLPTASFTEGILLNFRYKQGSPYFQQKVRKGQAKVNTSDRKQEEMRQTTLADFGIVRMAHKIQRERR